MTTVSFWATLSDPAARVYCGSCDWAGHYLAADDDIEDFEQRVYPGETTPVAQCPECGALCYLDEENK